MNAISNYQNFMDALKICMSMANRYLKRCLVEGTVDKENMRYFNNLLALHIDPETGNPKILCSNTNPKDSHEAIHSYNIRFIGIDEELMNKTDDEFNKENIDLALAELISQMSNEEKLKLYESLTE